MPGLDISLTILRCEVSNIELLHALLPGGKLCFRLALIAVIAYRPVVFGAELLAQIFGPSPLHHERCHNPNDNDECDDNNACRSIHSGPLSLAMSLKLVPMNMSKRAGSKLCAI